MVERRSGGNWAITDPAPFLDQMRLIKDDGDWKMGLKKAIDISVAAHLEAIKSVEPGMYNHEIQAGILNVCSEKTGRRGMAIIVSSGPVITARFYTTT
ncbi:MAG: hypothetical protein E2O76_10590 [Caldithrix sp.]|nr:MAG: hypothetical protein E2O76_10590 [Caldithrix sp.]